jgi:hypothetical protein
MREKGMPGANWVFDREAAAAGMARHGLAGNDDTMNTTSKRTFVSARTKAWASPRRLAGAFTVVLALLAQHASATTYNVFGGTKSTWPSTWQTLPGLVSSAVNSGLSGSLSRLDFVGVPLIPPPPTPTTPATFTSESASTPPTQLTPIALGLTPSCC